MQQPILINQQIQEEKRRRNQIYVALDYIFSGLTYFEYFSLDAFLICKNAKYLANFYNKKQVSSEFILLSFFASNSNISALLQDFGISKESLSPLFSLDEFKSKNFFSPQQNLENFSYESNLLFEHAAENAFFRFKSPIITSEILFLTLLEKKELKIHKLFKKIVKNETLWHLLRYRLIKNIHTQESIIRNEISKNQQYFGYLLRTQLSEKEYQKLLNSQLVSSGVSLFRNSFVASLLKNNYFDLLGKEAYASIELTGIRQYSD